jgi:superfamily II DNA or RNA helicase
LKIIINNEIRIIDCPEILTKRLVETLTHDNPEYVNAKKYGNSVYRVPKLIYNFRFDNQKNIVIPRGMMDELLYICKELDIDVSNIDDNRSVVDTKYISDKNLAYRNYQLDAMVELVTNHDYGILVSPAGSGKTIMGLSLLPILMQSTLWLTHTDALLNQSMARYKEVFPDFEEKDIGIIGSGEWTIGKVITFGMIPTLIRNLEKLSEIKNSFGLMILDEAHHSPASTFKHIINQINSRYFYGLTATAYRLDGLESVMFQCIGPIRYEIPKEEVVSHGGIIQPKVIVKQISFGPIVDDNNVHRISKNYIINNNERNNYIANDVVEEAKKGNFCIVACGTRRHCDILYKIIKKDWVRIGVATGKYNKKIINSVIEELTKKSITVLVTTAELLGEGFDVDFLNRLFMATSLRSEAKVEQLVGRIQRTHEDKKDALIYDYVDKNIGIYNNQFRSRFGNCRYNVYKRLGLKVVI